MCGCGGSAAARSMLHAGDALPSQLAMRKTNMSTNEASVLFEYIGPGDGATFWRAPSGNLYEAGRATTSRYVYIADSDVTWADASAVFRRYVTASSETPDGSVQEKESVAEEPGAEGLVEVEIVAETGSLNAPDVRAYKGRLAKARDQ